MPSVAMPTEASLEPADEFGTVRTCQVIPLSSETTMPAPFPHCLFGR